MDRVQNNSDKKIMYSEKYSISRIEVKVVLNNCHLDLELIPTILLMLIKHFLFNVQMP